MAFEWTLRFQTPLRPRRIVLTSIAGPNRSGVKGLPPARNNDHRLYVMTSRKTFPLVCCAAVVFSIAGQGFAWAECHRQKTCNRCSVPGYAYTHDDREVSKRVIAVGDPITRVTWRHPTRTVRSRSFHFPVRALVTDQVKLETVGLILYSDGKLSATGRLINDGGPDGDLKGNRVIVRIQAFTAMEAQQGELANAPVVWQSEQRLWVSRDKPQMTSLVGDGNRVGFRHCDGATRTRQMGKMADLSRLRQHFDEITHLEVELAYRDDR